MMNNLFNETTGFRLARLEVYNWGTFHNEIWTMQPDTQTAVLTGANGSGKSTVVDALLTLLVEGRKRNYNLASGLASRRERNERTYVRGQYSRSRSEDSIEAKANSLRGSESHSVLLAVFLDPSRQKTVTLAQILWLSNVDRVEKRFYVAPFELTIEQHFGQRHVTGRNLPNGVQTGSSFSEYIRAARKLLGLNGKPKALDLFNQTVAVKDITGLNSFVREHMLDKGNPEERVETLRTQYRELNEAHAAIQKAARQLEILTPLVESGREYRRYETQIERYEAARPLIPFYVAGQARKLLIQAIKTAEGRREAEQSRLDTVEADLESLRHSLEQVKFSIAQNSVGQMKREIESRLPSLRGEIEALKRAAKSYDRQATLLGLPLYQNEDDFHKNRTRAKDALQKTEAAITALESQRTEAEFEQRDLVKQAEELDKEIKYLRQNLSNIPSQVARIRQEIGAALDLPAETLTFVGELLRVRDEDAAWEGALERLLHNFAQDLLVPEAHYAAVSHFVNSHNLRGRLVYRRIQAQRATPPPVAAAQAGAELAFDKLQIKQDTPHHDWLAAELMRRFDYVCCPTLADFQQAERAITREGQIKHNRSRHEKDDRHSLNDRSRYVLGWDNRQKLRQLETELNDVARQTQKLAAEIVKVNQTLERRRNEIRALENLLDVETFASIDWRSRQTELDRLENQLANLDDSELRNLEQQRDGLQAQVSQIAKRRDDFNRRIAVFDKELSDHRQELRKANQMLETATNETRALAARVKDVFTEISKETPTIDRLKIWPDELETSIRNRVGAFRGYQNRSQAIIVDAMHTFRREYADEGAALTADIAALAAFEQIQQRLETDDLPKYEAQFKTMLDRTVSRGVTAFFVSLNEQERQIERSINELNDSLAKVDYGSGSTIRLIAERTRDAEINEFRRQLEACVPNFGDDSREELERAFGRIKMLIERFDNDPGWMRRVIDVRRWREFSAEQLDANGQQVDYYTDSSGKSGGQKAKLAYTILASAIAYQYGLQDSLARQKSFRFVVIDEAFSKLDDDNARFAMQLFNQLGLQLLVVTPMQQLHIIENYVQTYHLVVNNAEGNHSRLFNLTQAEYVERRREFLAQVQAL